jgi:hypothetical protein
MWTLRRDTLIIYGYDQARKVGEKHAAAIKEVRYVQESDSRMPISETEVTRPGALAAKTQTVWSCCHQTKPLREHPHIAQRHGVQNRFDSSRWTTPDLSESERR